MEKHITKSLAVILIAVFTSLTVYSQKMYLNIGGGYGFVASPDRYSPNNFSSYDDGTNTSYTYESINGSGSYGKGIQLGGTFGYLLTKNIGAELNISYLFGAKTTNTRFQSNSSNISTGEESVSGNMLRFTPAILLTTDLNKLKPYMRIGLVIGTLASVKEISYSTNTIAANTTQAIEGEYTGGTAFGYTGSFGADYMLGKWISIFCEFSIISQSWAPEKYETTKYEINGTDQISTLVAWEREREFVENYTYTSSNNNQNRPALATKIYLPFSSIGFNVGLHFYLDGKKK
jgi:hypothetical protein